MEQVLNKPVTPVLHFSRTVEGPAPKICDPSDLSPTMAPPTHCPFHTKQHRAWQQSAISSAASATQSTGWGNLGSGVGRVPFPWELWKNLPVPCLLQVGSWQVFYNCPHKLCFISPWLSFSLNGYVQIHPCIRTSVILHWEPSLVSLSWLSSPI